MQKIQKFDKNLTPRPKSFLNFHKVAKNCYKKCSKPNKLYCEISWISWIFLARNFIFFLVSHKKSKTKKNAMCTKDWIMYKSILRKSTSSPLPNSISLAGQTSAGKTGPWYWLNGDKALYLIIGYAWCP